MLVGEVNMGMGDEDGEDKEWVCDTRANYHMCKGAICEKCHCSKISNHTQKC